MEDIKQQSNRDTEIEAKATERLQTGRFLKLFIDNVLNTKDPISFENRVKLESDIRQLQDKTITAQWDVFVASKDSKEAQVAAAINTLN